MSLIKTLLLLLTGIVIISLGITGYTLIHQNQSILRTFQRDIQSHIAQNLADNLANAIDSLTKSIEVAALQKNLIKAPHKDQDQFIRTLMEKNPVLNMVSIFDPQAIEPLRKGFVGSPSEVAAHIQQVRLMIDEQHFARWHKFDNKQFLTLLFPLKSQQIDGYIGVELDLGWMTDLITEPASNPGSIYPSMDPTHGLGYIINRKGQLIAAPHNRPPPAIDALLQVPQVASYLKKSDLRPRVLTYQTDDQEGILAAFHPIPFNALDWIVIVQQPTTYAYAQVRSMVQMTLKIMGGLLIVCMALGTFLARQISRPLEDCAQGALEISKGKFGEEVAVDSKRITCSEIADLTRIFNHMSVELKAYDDSNKELLQRLEEGFLETVRALANSIDAKDPYTRGHSQRVTEFSQHLAKAAGLSEEQVKLIQFGALLHDIGKIGISEAILCKPAALTDEEFEIMKQHPSLGASIIEPIQFLSPMQAMIRNHHERWDGRGYPDGLAAEEIPLEARIVHIADTFDAMTTQRPYNTPLTKKQAAEVFRNISGKQTDPHLTGLFIDILVSQIEPKANPAADNRISHETHVS